MKKILALLLALLLLTGCGAASKSQSADTAMTEDFTTASVSTAPMPEPDIAYEEAEIIAEDAYDTPYEEPASPQETLSGGTEEKTVDWTEKLIYSASITIETMEFDKAAASLEKLAGALGGFVASSQVSGNSTWGNDGSTRVVDRYAMYSIRVPAEKFQEAVRQAGTLGSVTGSSTSVENITSQFTDQQARKHSLEVQEERLLALLEKADTVDSLVVLESSLSQVRYEIEAIERTLRDWQNQVDYSTITIHLQEVASYTPTATVQRSFGDRLGDSLRDGWNGFVKFLENLTLDLAGAVPVLILAAAGLVIAFLVVRRLRRSRKTRGRSAKVPAWTPDESEKPVKSEPLENPKDPDEPDAKAP